MKLGRPLATGVAQEQPLDQPLDHDETHERPEDATARAAEPQAPAPEEVPAVR
ncbi:hypothetical protein ABZ922_23845 [Streptomyces shenzhenensis]|uniref:hypothetical protein n=1 Tax=Streptomyces shenzhenensis TaxID=943815 RepID=UPI0033C6E9EC